MTHNLPVSYSFTYVNDVHKNNLLNASSILPVMQSFEHFMYSINDSQNPD